MNTAPPTTRPPASRWRPRAVTVGATVAAGALLTLSLPPWGWWPLAPVGVALLCALIEGRSARARYAVVFGAHLVFFGVSLSWVNDFNPVAAPLLTLILAGMVGLIGPLTPPGPARWLALPAAWTLVEALRWSWPFGGVPLSNLAMAQAGGPLLPTARLATALTLVCLVAMAGVALDAARCRRPRISAVAAAVLVLALAAAAVAPTGTTIGTAELAVVQGGGPLGTRAVDSDPSIVFQRHLDASEQVPPGTDLTLWPEDVVDVDGPFADSEALDRLAELAGRRDTTLVVGTVEKGDDIFFNRAQVVSADGELGGFYEKVNRVPFGEYVPFRSFVDRFVDLRLIPRDASVGTGPALVETPLGPLATVISFELFFPRRARDGYRNEGRLLLGPTNASSYRDTRVPEQTLASARLRAVEGGRWVAQAAPTGYSAIVDEQGRVLQRTGLREAAVLSETVELREGDTLSTRFGRVPLLWLALAALVAAWTHQRDPGRWERLRPRVGR